MATEEKKAAEKDRERAPEHDTETLLKRALATCARLQGVVRDRDAELGWALALANCRWLSFTNGMLAGGLVAGLAVTGFWYYDRRVRTQTADEVRLQRAYSALRDLTDHWPSCARPASDPANRRAE